MHEELLRASAEEVAGRSAAPADTLLAVGRLMQSLAARRVAEHKRFFKRWAGFDSPENLERARAQLGANGGEPWA